MDGTENRVQIANRRTVSRSDFLLRFLAFITALVAIILIAISKQTKMLPVTLYPGLPPVDVEVLTKWKFVSAFTFLMISNIIACVYAALSIIFSFTLRVGSKNLISAIFILDMTMMSLLFSANGAAAAVGYLGYKGNSHVQWNKVCNVFGRFCGLITGSVALSFVGCSAFFALILLATFTLK